MLLKRRAYFHKLMNSLFTLYSFTSLILHEIKFYSEFVNFLSDFSEMLKSHAQSQKTRNFSNSGNRLGTRKRKLFQLMKRECRKVNFEL